jgi:hypothetical protein
MKELLATRVDPRLRHRLRVYAAVTGQTYQDVVSAALDGYLPPLAEMVATVLGGQDSPRPALLPGGRS